MIDYNGIDNSHELLLSRIEDNKQIFLKEIPKFIENVWNFKFSEKFIKNLSKIENIVRNEVFVIIIDEKYFGSFLGSIGGQIQIHKYMGNWEINKDQYLYSLKDSINNLNDCFELRYDFNENNGELWFDKRYNGYFFENMSTFIYHILELVNQDLKIIKKIDKMSLKNIEKYYEN